MKFDFSKRIASLSRKAVVEATKADMRISDTESVDLSEIFNRGLGKNWPTMLKYKVAKVQKRINEDIRNERVNLDVVDNPARFIVNSIALHTLELMVVKAGRFESLHELRQAEWHDYLHKHVEALELQDS